MSNPPAQEDPGAWAKRHPDLMLALLRWREADTPASAACWFRKIGQQLHRISAQSQAGAHAAPIRSTKGSAK